MTVVLRWPKTLSTNTFLVIYIAVLLTSCIDRINSDGENSASRQLVVDGFISDQPGPHRIRLFYSSDVYSNLERIVPFKAKSVSIRDNTGHEEFLVEGYNGFYDTGSDYHSREGVTYTLHIESYSGEIFESTAETAATSGTLDSIYFVLENTKPINGKRRYYASIYVDADPKNSDSHFRWRLMYTFKVRTFPDPADCCSICWVTAHENNLTISNAIINSVGKLPRVKVGSIPIEERTLHEKIRVDVTQQGLSRTAFEFWRVVKLQDGLSGLFQPSIGTPLSNMRHINGDQKPLGIFFVSTTDSKSIFITRSEIRNLIEIPDSPIVYARCQVFPNSTTEQPPGWD